MKKIIVACGGAVATSTVAADAIRDLCAQMVLKQKLHKCVLLKLLTIYLV